MKLSDDMIESDHTEREVSIRQSGVMILCYYDMRSICRVTKNLPDRLHSKTTCFSLCPRSDVRKTKW